MATFEEHIEAATKLDITSSSVPSQDNLTEFLQDAIVSTVNNLSIIKPDEAFKFAAESEAANDSGITVTGRILSVVREHDSTEILRPCSPIPSSLKYESTDKESLYYRSKFNPGYFVSNGKIFVRPAAAGSNNDMKVSQLSYDIGSGGLAYSDNYNQGAVANFPIEYEYLLSLYASALCCNAKALDINNNMPTVPTVPNSPDFSIDSVSLPELPIFNIEVPNFDTWSASNAIAKEDFDKAEKLMSLFDKKIESYSKQFQEEELNYQKDLELYKSELENLVKDADRKVQVQNSEYTAEIERYSAELQFFKNDLEEAAVQYKWYSAQYVTFMNQYNSAVGLKVKQPKQEKQRKKESKGEE
ncbi:MAG: hypothetical protein CBC83_00075 [Flavobacteriales bacterium TMED123]|nr:MAG: hypothetical protein CBC83_00075 [Flavobacteriales bacterium TMED123]